ncbi:MAG: hypothetical protein EBZ48_04325, partial [Proteobacteria bacterium]|nr:hypothetical protein [Pseudomonadota bacterium]
MLLQSSPILHRESRPASSGSASPLSASSAAASEVNEPADLDFFARLLRTAEPFAPEKEREVASAIRTKVCEREALILGRPGVLREVLRRAE